MDRTVLFIDTSVLLHYQPLKQIDWCALSKKTPITLVIPAIVMRELDKHKDFGSTQKIRKRAQRVTSELLAFWGDGLRATIRPGVDLEFLTTEPTIDFAANHLSREVQDDYLLASIVEYQTSHRDETCLIVTRDSGLLLKARARGIGRLAVPDESLLPEEEDPEQAKIRALERENLELKNRVPRLKIMFDDGSESKTFQIRSRDDSREVSSEMHKVRAEYPKVILPAPNSPAEIERLRATTIADIARGARYAGSVARPDPEKVAAYNAAIDRFLTEYEAYLDYTVLRSEQLRLSIPLTFRISNSGTMPSEGIQVHLHFPNGMKVVTTDNLPTPGEAPVPPEKILSTFDEIKRQSERLNNFGLQLPASAPLYDIGAPATFSNVSTWEIRETNSYDVSFGIRKLSHGFDEEIGGLHVLFNSPVDCRSFHVEYTLHAENLPKPNKGALHVIVAPQTSA